MTGREKALDRIHRMENWELAQLMAQAGVAGCPENYDSSSCGNISCITCWEGELGKEYEDML